ncbi:hypothetical protein [uncultured Paraglaciecola sp.]|uniref:hypothetical protein n=1 Tax=uncultured Paraglaciecola sp. TaxID=1765024 RepID=UPI00259518DC|nr:hypothetical protein [uncultured Paraglaciecola sp.]
MKIINLIEHISESDDTGLLKIKPLINVCYDSFKSTVIYKNESVHKRLHQEVTFDADIWRSASNSVNFSSLSGEIRYEVKSAFFLANYSGSFEGGTGLKFGSVRTQIVSLIKFGEFIQGHHISSISAFNHLPSLIKRNHMITFITQVMGLNHEKTFDRRFFQQYLCYGLFSDDTLLLFEEELDNHGVPFECRRLSQRSHPIVPSNLLKRVISECDLRLSEASKAIEEWEPANNRFTDHIRKRKYTSRVFKNISSAVKGGSGYNATYITPLRSGFEAFDNLKTCVLMYILTYTGMRKEEALSCKVGCESKHDGKYYVEAVLTKTDDNEIKMKWVANEETFEAIQLLSRYIKGIHKRAQAVLENSSLRTTDSLRHHLTRGLEEQLLFGVADNLTSVLFTDAHLGTITDRQNTQGKNPRFSLQKFQYELTEQDMDQLESLGCNYKAVKGNYKGHKYDIGDIFRITPHMLRHNFAWFIIANKLGELDDIKHQFKHLASSMTMVYASRGYESPEEMIGLFEDFEEMLVENIAEEITQQAVNGTLTGEGGKRLNEGAKSLVFNVTAAKGSDTGRTVKQIHFKSLNAYKAFLTQNLKNIRGLPHGYCTGGSTCKLKNVGLPSGCVYCPSYLVSERQRVHWRAMKNFADNKLIIYDKLPPDKQAQFSLMAESWRDTSNAALIILKENIIPTVNEVLS